MSKLNCWDFMQCGREPGGTHADERGVCPTSTATQHDGINGGANGGRYCWAIGTFCNNGRQGYYAEKLGDCALCYFYRTVEREEERQFVVVART